MTGVGMFNALVMSYTRLPMAMAEDGMLPRAVARRNSRGRAVGKRASVRTGLGRWRSSCPSSGSSPST
jgi:hypothetical protein